MSVDLSVSARWTQTRLSQLAWVLNIDGLAIMSLDSHGLVGFSSIFTAQSKKINSFTSLKINAWYSSTYKIGTVASVCEIIYELKTVGVSLSVH